LSYVRLSHFIKEPAAAARLRSAH